MSAPEQLIQVATAAKEKGPVRLSPRQLLAYYGNSRRGKYVVSGIRRDLKKLGVQTDPDFEYVWIDGSMRLVPLKSEQPAKQSKPKALQEETVIGKAELPDVSPSHRISRLKAANTKPVTVKPTDKLETAVTLMMSHDFSQLPVMTTEREVKGIISWRSIGNRLVLNQKCEVVRECMEPHHEVRDTASMFDVIRQLGKYECVLVRDSSGIITGIVTAADISEQFQLISEPFILLGDIENDLRRLVERSFSLEEIKKARDSADESRKVESAADLTFGEYVRLLENTDNWTKLKLSLDRVVFTKALNDVREIRNDVMHFDPDGVADDAQKALRQFAAFLERLETLRAR